MQRKPPAEHRRPGLGSGGPSFYFPVGRSDESLPLRVTEVGESRWRPGDGMERACSAILAVELVHTGSIHLDQDGRTTLIGPGQGFILKRGSRHSYRAADERVHKSYVGLEGPLADHVLATAPDLVAWPDHPRAARLIRDIRNCIERRQDDWQGRASVLAYTLLIEIGRAAIPPERVAHHAALDRILPLLEAPRGHAMRVADIARDAGLSPSQLHRIFQAELGTSPRQYANAFAMRRAQHALLHTDRPCAEIAADLGYEPHYFSAIFRRLVGVSPQRFRAGRG